MVMMDFMGLLEARACQLVLRSACGSLRRSGMFGRRPAVCWMLWQAGFQCLSVGGTLLFFLSHASDAQRCNTCITEMQIKTLPDAYVCITNRHVMPELLGCCHATKRRNRRGKSDYVKGAKGNRRDTDDSGKGNGFNANSACHRSHPRKPSKHRETHSWRTRSRPRRIH